MIQDKEFFRYYGSLTTPPCTEGIVWTVIKEPMPISKAQLNHFHVLYAGDPAFAGGNGNYRMIMPLEDRTLYSGGGAMALTSAAFAVAAAMLAAF